MERKEPYIGDGTPADREPRPRINQERSRGPWLAIIMAIAILGASAATYYLWSTRDRTLPLPPGGAVAPTPSFPVAKGPQHPLEKEPAGQPLPELKASDGPVAAALASVVGLDAFGRTFLTENLVRNIVATIDNLPNDQVSRRVMPVQPVTGIPVTVGKAGALTFAPANAARYAPYLRMLESTPTPQLVAFYRRHYPLFQQAYVELGYPNGYFNDRLVQVIDHLLDTPEPAGPLRLTQPKVLYEFADPALEQLSAGQKTMLRIGKGNRERVKAKLREVRAGVAG